MSKKQTYLILIHLVILIWGFTGIMGRAIDLSSSVLVWYRLLFAFISLGIFIRVLNRPRKKIEKAVFLKIIGVGVVVGLHWFTFFEAIKMSSISLGIICLSTASFHVAWLSPLMERTKISKVELFFGLLAIFGIFFIVQTDVINIPSLLMGLTSAFLAAFFSTSNAYLVKKVPSAQLTFIELISGFVVLTFILLFEGRLDASLLHLSMPNLFNLLFLGIVCTSLAFIIAVDATKYLGAFTVSLTINLEPIYTMIMAIMIYPDEETMSVRFYLGALIIIAAVFSNGIFRYSKAKREKKSIVANL
ncbi:MAG: DMT family transporter [Crocinitomicaceae bacterium]